MKTKHPLLVGTAALSLVSFTPIVLAAQGGPQHTTTLVEIVRRATARFHNVAAAMAAGYAPALGCVSGPEEGAMGIHFVRGDLVGDGQLDPALGTDLLLVCSNVQPTVADDPARAAADLRELAERAAQRRLRIAYEALAWGHHVRRWREAWQIVRQGDHPALGLAVDSFHTLALDDDFTAAGVMDFSPLTSPASN